MLQGKVSRLFFFSCRLVRVKLQVEGFFFLECDQASTSVNSPTQTHTTAHATTMTPTTNSGARCTLNGGAVLK